MALRNLQISQVEETIVEGHRFLSFDVSLSGHLISTISLPDEQGQLMWSQSTVNGFEDFDQDDREAIEQQLRAIKICTKTTKLH